MPAFCSLLLPSYFSKNYAGKIAASLTVIIDDLAKGFKSDLQDFKLVAVLLQDKTHVTSWLLHVCMWPELSLTFKL